MIVPIYKYMFFMIVCYSGSVAKLTIERDNGIDIQETEACLTQRFEWALPCAVEGFPFCYGTEQ